MAPPILTLRGVALGYGGNPLFADLELNLARGERVCLVGRNGSGKSTLMKVLAGLVEPDAGEVFVQPGAAVAYLPQEPALPAGTAVADWVAQGLPAGDADAHHRVERLLATLGVASGADCATLSGGEGRRAALARVLAAEPDVLLLDEPTNHLDLPTIALLEETLTAFRGTVVAVSHDRRFLSRLTRATLWLDRGRVRRLDAGFDQFEAWAVEQMEIEARERAKLDKLIAEETRWSHEGITARRTRNMGRMRRLDELRAERAAWTGPAGRARMEAESGRASGRLGIEAEAITKSFGGHPVIAGFSTRILRGDRIGVIGPNGAGKSTLLRLLTGDLDPDAGTVRRGTNLDVTYLDQRRATLDPDKSVWETLCDMGGDQVNVRGRPRHVVGYLRDFLFEERQARSPVGALSGGERNRLLLAKALARPANLLVLDEPTNDLDMDTLDLLQEVLADYDGTLILVSHDRDFLDRTVTATIALEGDGTAREYPGGYADYERQRRAEAAPAAKAEKKAKAPAPSAAKPKAAAKPGKLSYKQQRALEMLPDEIAALEDEIAALETTLADPGLFTRDPAAFQAATDRLTAAQADQEAKEHEWLELEILREDLAG
ncbi:MAG: ATP-binding cassette domain-containing protein [Rhodobacterales bacterium]|nr:ATP-binding cassette domain-containing protein [Rhodobacterales bacterium]